VNALAIESPLGAYGAPELKHVFQRNWTLGLLIAVMIHMTVIGTYVLAGFLTEEEPPVVRIRFIDYGNLPLGRRFRSPMQR
jgi:hypothetical protein